MMYPLPGAASSARAHFLRSRFPHQPDLGYLAPAAVVAPARLLVEAEQRRAEKARVLVIRQPGDQVGTGRGIAEVVVEAAGTRIAPVQQAVNAAEALRFVGQGVQLGEPGPEPAAVIERPVD